MNERREEKTKEQRKTWQREAWADLGLQSLLHSSSHGGREKESVLMFCFCNTSTNRPLSFVSSLGQNDWIDWLNHERMNEWMKTLGNPFIGMSRIGLVRSAQLVQSARLVRSGRSDRQTKAQISSGLSPGFAHHDHALSYHASAALSRYNPIYSI